MFFSESWKIFYHFFHIFNLDIFLVLILQKRIGSRYLFPVTPTTVLSWSFWNFTGALRIVWRYACGFFRILKLFFITGFLLQYLCEWYRTNGPLVNLPIFYSSNKNKVGDINSLWNLLVVLKNPWNREVLLTSTRNVCLWGEIIFWILFIWSSVRKKLCMPWSDSGIWAVCPGCRIYSGYEQFTQIIFD